jgi:hypothetical protein
VIGRREQTRHADLHQRHQAQRGGKRHLKTRRGVPKSFVSSTC